MDGGFTCNSLASEFGPCSQPSPTTTRPVSAIATAARGGTARRILHRIRNTEINLALWERTLPAEAADFCAKLAVRSSALDLDLTGAPTFVLLDPETQLERCTIRNRMNL
jgi:hypothetical protein